MYLLFLFFMLTAAMTVSAQTDRRPRNMLRTNQLDTLSWQERIALRTNMLGWTLLSPNIGAELTLGTRNWSRWTLTLDARTMTGLTAEKAPYVMRDLRELRLGVRRYEHGRGLWRSLFVGAYGGYADYDMKMGPTGHRGDGLTVGITAGTIAPLYGYPNGSSLDLEVSINAGLLWANDEHYERQMVMTQVSENEFAERSQHVVTRLAKRGLQWYAPLYVAATDVLRVSLVYRLGPTVADRYRRRIAIDEEYRLHENEMSLRRDSISQAEQRQKQLRRDSLERVDYEKRFEQQRRELEQKHIKDSIRREVTGVREVNEVKGVNEVKEVREVNEGK